MLRSDALRRSAGHFFTAATLTLREDRSEWDALSALAGVPRRSLRLLNQVHGNRVVIASSAAGDHRPTADGIVTDDPALALVVRVADCAPLLIADTRQPVVAAVHAGWRSTMQGIGPAAVATLRAAYGSRPEDLVVAIGPSLGQCCGEMGDEVVEAFKAAGHHEGAISRWFVREPARRPHLNLWQANRDQLESAGVPPGSIQVAGLCTRSYPDVFHSYRARGASAGRMAAVIRAVENTENTEATESTENTGNTEKTEN